MSKYNRILILARFDRNSRLIIFSGICLGMFLLRIYSINKRPPNDWGNNAIAMTLLMSHNRLIIFSTFLFLELFIIFIRIYCPLCEYENSPIFLGREGLILMIWRHFGNKHNLNKSTFRSWFLNFLPQIFTGCSRAKETNSKLIEI